MADNTQKAIETLEAAVSAAPNFNDAVDKFSSYVAHMAEKYGQDMVDLIFAVVRFNSLANLLLGIVFATVAVIAARRFVFFVRKARVEVAESRRDEANGLTIVGIIGCAMATVIGTLIGGLNLLNIWNWVGVFAPDIALAARVLAKFIS